MVLEENINKKSFFNWIETKRLSGFILIFLVFLVFEFSLLYFSRLGLSYDEAQYWDWSRNLELSYYSKGPLVSYLIRLSSSIFGNSLLAVKLPGFICYNLFSFLLFLFLLKLTSHHRALAIWVASRLMLLFSQMAFVSTTDSPLSLCWLASTYFSYKAIFENKPRRHLMAGFFLGIGFLAKFTIAILPVGVFLFLILFLDKRFYLKNIKYFLLSLLVFLAISSPILVWNFSHDWVNFKHNSNHITNSKTIFSIKFFLELILGQLALVGPILFLGFIHQLYLGLKKPETKKQLFFCLTVLPLFILIVITSFTKRIYPNWTIPIYIAAILTLAATGKVSSFLNSRKNFSRAILLSGLITLIAQLSLFNFTFGLPAKILPTAKLYGWDELGLKTEEVLKTNFKKRPFIITNHYGTVAQLAFNLESKPFVYCSNIDGRRMNHYDIRANEKDWKNLKNKSALIVINKENQVFLDVYKNYFKKISPISTPLEIKLNGETIREFLFYKGEIFLGKPFPIPKTY